MSIGKRLKNRLDSLGLKQNELAKKLNISPTTLNGYFTDYREPDINTLKRLANALETTFEYLIGETNSPGLTQKSVASSEAETLGTKVMQMFIDAGKLAPGQELTDEFKEYATNLINAAIIMEKTLNKE